MKKFYVLMGSLLVLAFVVFWLSKAWEVNKQRK